MNGKDETGTEEMERIRARLTRLNQQLIADGQAKRWQKQTESADWLRSQRTAFEVARENQSLHANRAKELFEIVLVVGISSVLFNLLASSLQDILTGTGLLEVNLRLAFIFSILGALALIGFALYLLVLRALPPVTVAFSLMVPVELKPFLKESSYNQMASALRDQKLTDFRLYAKAFLQVLQLTLRRMGLEPNARVLKEHEQFLMGDQKDKVAWAIGRSYDVSPLLPRMKVHAELRVTLQPARTSYGAFPNVDDFTIWIQWAFPKPTQRHVAQAIDRLYSFSYELPMVIADTLAFIPIEEDALRSHISHVAMLLARLDSQAETGHSKESLPQA
jgi:hypothetical protein